MLIKKNVDLTSLNTLGLQSRADSLVELTCLEDLKSFHSLAGDSSAKVPWKILGGGSNLVLPAAIAGPVLKVANKGRDLIDEDEKYWFVKSQAGENWHDFVQWTLQQGFWGLENLSLIPGTVGAAPIQNIGAYGVEIKDFLWEVTCIDLSTGATRSFNNSQCRFSYRDSFFKQEGAGKYLVWEVTFRLPKNNTLHLAYGEIQKELERRGVKPSPQRIADAVVSIRQSKLPDPQLIGNAGSFFKNPVISKEKRDSLLKQHPELISFPSMNTDYKLAAGWLIDRAGWKGKSLGPVGMYEKQALVLVNHGGATSVDVWKLAQVVSADVKKIFDINLEVEPVGW